MNLRRRARARSAGPGPAPSRPPSRGRRALGWAGRRAGGAAMAVLLSTLLLCLLLAARLAMGPVSLGALGQEAARRLSAETPGLTVTVEDVTLDPGRDALPPGLRAIGLTVRDAQGQTILHAPRASVRFHVGDLLTGAIHPTSIAVAGLQLRVERDAHGALVALQDAGLAPEAAAPDAVPPDAGAPDVVPSDPGAPGPGGAAMRGGAVAALDRIEAASGPFARLRRVSFRDMRIALDDPALGRSLAVEGVDLTLRRAGARIEAEIAATEPGAEAPWLQGAASRRVGAGETGFQILVERGDGPALAAAAPELAALAALQAPLSGRILGRLDDGGWPRALKIDLEAGQGRIEGLPGPAGALEAARISLSLDPAGDRLRLSELTFDGGLGALRARGDGTALRGDGGRLDGGRLAVVVERLRLTEAAGFAAPRDFGPGRIEGDFLRDRAEMRLTEARIEAGPLEFSASGFARQEETGWTGALAARAIRPVPGVALAPSWPVDLAPGARDWVAQNILGGTIDALSFGMAFDPGGLEGALDFTFHDTVARPVEGLPPLTGARGAGVVTIPREGPAGFEIHVDEAVATPEGGEPVDLAGSTFAIPDAEAEIPYGHADLKANGRLVDVLSVLDHRPLRLVSKLGADLVIRSGRAQVEAALSLPLLKDMSVDEVEVTAEAALSDLSFVIPGLGLPATAPAATLSADATRLELSADGAVDGIPASAVWTEVFSPPEGTPPTRVSARASVGPKTAARYGAEGVIEEGAAAVRAEISVPRSGPVRIDARADLTGAALRLPAPDWRKPKGAAASARARLRIDRMIEGEVEAEASGLALGGEITVDPAGGGSLRRARLLTLSIDGAVEGAVEYVAGAPAQLRFDGPFLSLPALLGADGMSGGAEAGAAGGAATAGPAGGAALDLEVAARAGRLALTDTLALHDAEGAARLAASGAAAATLSGRAEGGAAVEARYEKDADGAPATVRLTAPDAGAALRDLAGFASAQGGALRLEATLAPGNGPVTGSAEIENVDLLGDDPMVRALAAASITGALAGGEGRLHLDRISAPFRLEGETLRLVDAFARGPSIGLTLGGTWRRDADLLDLSGVMTPAYALNGALNRVPVLGELLGGEGEGLFGVTFAVKGPAEDPQVSVNPLSALAPGVLRRIFGGATGGGGPDDGPPEPGGPEDK